MQMEAGINVCSLFDGNSCLQRALHEEGVPVRNYFASEIDKYAIAVTMHHFPDTIQLGDVRTVTGADLPKIDLLVGGSPCQGFSFAGKMMNFDDPRSKLFFEFVRVLEEVRTVNPNVKFLLENVVMRKKDAAIISRYLGVTPQKINSKIVSAQNRERLYWTNIANFDTFAMVLPPSKGLVLKDIMQPRNEVAERYRISDEKMAGFLNDSEKQAEKGNGFALKLRTTTAIATAITCKEGNRKTSNYIQLGENKQQTARYYHTEAVAPCITANNARRQKVVQINPSKASGGTQPHQSQRVYDAMGISACITHGFAQGADKLHTEDGIWRLTEIECERLQTLPDNYTKVPGVSMTQRYKMLGNGMTVAVIRLYIKHFIKNL
jgi:DNA-cytosine methyltransferase